MADVAPCPDGAVPSAGISHRFVQLTDLHLSDVSDSGASAALEWAVRFVNDTAPDFLAVSGDVTTYGTRRSAECFVEALDQIHVPVLFTPGNAELRDPGALLCLAPLVRPEKRVYLDRGLLVLLPDTSTGMLPDAERDLMTGAVRAHPGGTRRIVITHYPMDRLASDSRAWLDAWIQDSAAELLVAGHTHRHDTDSRTGCLEVVTRGLDPDKATGDLPGLSLFESDRRGVWTESFHPWSPELELLPSDVCGGGSPVGWSIHGDPVEAAQETLDAGLNCLEFRPRGFEFSPVALRQGVRRLRSSRSCFLSYHLPDLRWDPDARRIVGQEVLERNLEVAVDIRADSLTVHVPRATASAMEAGAPISPTALWLEFVDLFEALFDGYVEAGGRLAIEHIHNGPDTPADCPERAFATDIPAYVRWIEQVGRLAGSGGKGCVGAHLDLGHARNNGGALDNTQPLGDWYAQLGSRILSYHVHQIGVHPETGRLANHLAISGLFGPRISYAGFLWAWSTRKIPRAPLLVEVRDHEGRRRTASLLQGLFQDAAHIREASDLPGRASVGT